MMSDYTGVWGRGGGGGGDGVSMTMKWFKYVNKTFAGGQFFHLQFHLQLQGQGQ